MVLLRGASEEGRREHWFCLGGRGAGGGRRECNGFA